MCATASVTVNVKLLKVDVEVERRKCFCYFLPGRLKHSYYVVGLLRSMHFAVKAPHIYFRGGEEKKKSK